MLINILILILIIILIYQIFLANNNSFKNIEGLTTTESTDSSGNSNIFDAVMSNANEIQDKLLGPTYPYYKNIKTPSEIGMTDKGTISALTSDINGLINYMSVLVEGKSRASATGGPLGNKFFLQTGAKCNDVATNTEEDRFIYINNVPEGNIPFISQGLGVNFSEFKGLIPGSMSNLNALNPFAILQSFMSGSTPDCQELTMQTIDINNNKSTETHFVTLVDIQNMDPCSFPDKINPKTNDKCRETFQSNNKNNSYDTGENKLPSDLLSQTYILSLSLLTIFLFYKIMEKSFQ
jgi:hypothetical protein